MVLHNILYVKIKGSTSLKKPGAGRITHPLTDVKLPCNTDFELQNWKLETGKL